MKASQLIINPQLGLNQLYDINLIISAENLVILPTESASTYIAAAIAAGDPDGLANISIIRISDSATLFSIVTNDINTANAMIASFKFYYAG